MKHSKLLLFSVIVNSLLIASSLPVMAEPGIGLPDEQAEQLQAFWDAGGDIHSEEAWAIVDSANLGGGGSASSYSTPAASSSTPSSTGSSAQSSSSKAESKTYSHDFDEITEEAQEAFVYFTHDGEDGSCYINISANSTNNLIKGETLNATSENSETGKISFVDDGNMVYEWIFEGFSAPEDSTLDLGLEIKKDDSEYEGTYSISSVSDNTIEGGTPTLRIQTDLPDGTVYIYEVQDDAYNEIATTEVSENGIVELKPTKLGNYAFSSTDINAAIEEAEKKKAEEEAKALEEQKATEAEEAAAKEAEEAAKEEVQPAEPVETASTETTPEKSNSALPIVGAVVGIIAIAGIAFAIFRKK